MPTLQPLRGTWLPSLQAAAVVALAHVPALTEALPVLGIFRGPLGVVLVAATIVMTATGAACAQAAARAGARTRLVAALVLFSAAGLNYSRGIQATGDEIEYLLLTQSLWLERDLDIRDNFDRGDHLEYTPGLGKMPFGTFRKDGRPISTHSPGLPLLLAPVYALGGRSACLLLLALLAALLADQVYRLALQLTQDPRAALLGWTAALGPPIFFYSFHLYPALPSTLALVLALRLLLASPGAWQAAAAALLAGTLPWLHVKMIPAAAVLGVVALLRLRGRPLVAFLGTALLMAAGYAAHYWIVFGDPTPLALYGSRVPKKIRRAVPGASLPGLFLDSSFGLLPNAPVFLLALAALIGLRRRFRELAPHVAVGLAVLAPLLVWQTWWAGHCPPARFLVPLVPLLALLVAARQALGEQGLARWGFPLALGGLALAIFMSLYPDDHLMLNVRSEPTHVWEALAGRASPGHYLPRLVARQAADGRVALVWAGILAALLALDVQARRRPRIDRLFSGLGLPLALLVVLGLLVDGWARAG